MSRSLKKGGMAELLWTDGPGVRKRDDRKSSQRRSQPEPHCWPELGTVRRWQKPVNVGVQHVA